MAGLGTRPAVIVVGSFNHDHIWLTERFPEVGETCVGRFSAGPGGKGFNQAIACHRQGIATRFVGALGRDRLGDSAAAYAEVEGLDCYWQRVDDEATGSCAVLVDARGRNQIIVGLGANALLSVEHVRAALATEPAVVLCQLETCLDATRAALAMGRESGALAILNPAPVAAGVDRELLSLAEILTPNETEFALLLERVWGVRLDSHWWQAPDEDLHALCRLTGIGTVVITLGDQGCFVSHAPGQLHGDTQHCYRVAAESVEVLDSTGAGDAFSGGLAASLVRLHDTSFRSAVEAAGRIAGLSVERLGAAPAMPTLAELQARYPEG